MQGKAIDDLDKIAVRLRENHIDLIDAEWRKGISEMIIVANDAINHELEILEQDIRVYNSLKSKLK